MREVPDTPTLDSRKRVLLFLALSAVQLIYVPINRLVTGGVILQIPWDAHVPFWPIFSIPYMASVFWWTVCILWAAMRMDALRLRAFFFGALFMMLTSYIIFIVYPTYIERPDVTGQGFQYDLIRSIYSNDRLNNAFPSGHTYFTVFIVLFWWKWKPRLKWIWAAFGALVIASTLFTGQHNLLDPVGGIVWAVGSYRFGWLLAKRRWSG